MLASMTSVPNGGQEVVVVFERTSLRMPCFRSVVAVECMRCRAAGMIVIILRFRLSIVKFD